MQELDKNERCSDTAATQTETPAANQTTQDEPIFVARYFVLDANGKRREVVRTRSGREIPILTEEDAEEYFKKYTYED